jgi:pyridoxal phosphate enzyme (YggS family)
MLISPQNLTVPVNLVRARIEQAARHAGRDPDTVTLVAVTKGKSAELIAAAATAGVTDFGENYLKEALPKLDALDGLAVRWHFIGQLQSNKTRAVAERFAWVHSVDRLAVARRLSEQRPFHAPPLNVCLQVQLMPEAGKGGVDPVDVVGLATAVSQLPRLALRGLMCVPPPLESPQAQGALFARLREMLAQLNATGLSLDTLSMGMSGDFEAAIAQGATMVRIGTALFGPREAPA